MAKVFLSPSAQKDSLFVNGGDESYYMNLIVDAMIPYLGASNIQFHRNTPGDSLLSILEQSNSLIHHLHLAIQTNIAPEEQTGILQGCIIFYSQSSLKSKKAATIFQSHLLGIYPSPEKVKTLEDSRFSELKKVNAPALLVSLAYHDNREDAKWLCDHINGIAKTLSQSIADFFHMPFTDPYETPYQ